MSNDCKSKLLGSELDSTLSWDAHTGQLCKNLSRDLYLLCMLSLCVE